MKPLDELQRTVEALDLPAWVERVKVSEMWDMDDEPALRALIVIREGHEDVVEDGEALARAWMPVTRALIRADGERWAYSRFAWASESGAA